MGRQKECRRLYSCDRTIPSTVDGVVKPFLAEATGRYFIAPCKCKGTSKYVLVYGQMSSTRLYRSKDDFRSKRLELVGELLERELKVHLKACSKTDMGATSSSYFTLLQTTSIT